MFVQDVTAVHPVWEQWAYESQNKSQDKSKENERSLNAWPNNLKLPIHMWWTKRPLCQMENCINSMKRLRYFQGILVNKVGQPWPSATTWLKMSSIDLESSFVWRKCICIPVISKFTFMLCRPRPSWSTHWWNAGSVMASLVIHVSVDVSHVHSSSHTLILSCCHWFICTVYNLPPGGKHTSSVGPMTGC